MRKVKLCPPLDKGVQEAKQQLTQWQCTSVTSHYIQPCIGDTLIKLLFKASKQLVAQPSYLGDETTPPWSDFLLCLRNGTHTLFQFSYTRALQTDWHTLHSPFFLNYVACKSVLITVVRTDSLIIQPGAFLVCDRVILERHGQFDTDNRFNLEPPQWLNNTYSPWGGKCHS